MRQQQDAATTMADTRPARPAALHMTLTLSLRPRRCWAILIRSCKLQKFFVLFNAVVWSISPPPTNRQPASTMRSVKCEPIINFTNWLIARPGCA